MHAIGYPHCSDHFGEWVHKTHANIGGAESGIGFRRDNDWVPLFCAVFHSGFRQGLPNRRCRPNLLFG